MRSLFLYPFLLFASTAALAQDEPTVDLTMSPNGLGQVEIRLRTDGYFDGVASGLTFTLRWPASAGLALDTAVRCYPFQDVLPISAVSVQQVGDFMYRTFNGFGASPLFENGLAWNAGREYPICTADILVPGTTIELINDAYTDTSNRGFFCSLGGWEHTGAFFQSPEPAVDIHSLDQGTGNLDVVLTPQDEFFGWVTDLTFTARWPSGSGVHLGSIVQPTEVAEYLTIEKIGPETTSGGYTYQVFHGHGLRSIANSDDGWQASQGITVLAVPIFGSSPEINIANDAWTATHGGDYHIELNGNGRTGIIEGIAMHVPASSREAFAAHVVTNPNGFVITLDLPPSPQPLEVSLHNVAGQAIWSASSPSASQHYVVFAGTGPVPEGMYILSVRHGNRMLTERIVH